MGTLVDGCVICNGMGQVAAGQACPVCGGTGVATAEQAAAYRQVLVDAAVQAATERFRQAGTSAADGLLRGLAQAREDAKETTARAGEVLSALLEVRRTAREIQAASLEIRSHPAAALFVEPSAPDPTDPPPGITLPAGMGGEIFYMDSLLVRQLDVWGPFNAPNAPGILANPMMTLGDTIYGLALGVPQRLGIGGAGQVLTVVGGVPAWANSAAGFTNPMTTSQDLIVGGVAGAAGRLGVGANGQILTVTAGVVGWANAAAGFANPMTSKGDLIVADVGGAALRLPVGTAGQVLTVAGGTAIWQTNPAGFTNPMTTSGDMIVATAGGTATRLPVGANQQVLTVTGGVPTWAASPSTLGTPLAGPPGTPTVWKQSDGSLVVLPLSYWGLSGDDSVWFNTAFTLLPTIAGGSAQYGGTYNGPWIVGTVRGLAADYTINTGIVMPVNSGVTINLIGQGPGSRLLVGGSGSTVGITSHCAMGGPQAGHPAQQTAGRIAGWKIDGQAGGLTGVELGGSWGREVDVIITNFQLSGSIGLHILNAPNPSGAAEWTEKSRMFVDLLQNTTAVVIEQTANLASGGSDSCEYNDFWFYIIQSNAATNGPGVLLRGGAYLSGGSLHIRGNFPANSGPVLSITGQDSTSGTWSSIYHELVDITVESNASSNIPQTINFGSVSNFLHQCQGIMSFQFATFVASNAVNANIGFAGVIDGDNTLLAANSAVTTPAIPAANATKLNTTNVACTVYVQANGATGMNVNINGINTGLTSGAFEVPDDGNIGLGNYVGGPPTWTWIGHL